MQCAVSGSMKLRYFGRSTAQSDRNRFRQAAQSRVQGSLVLNPKAKLRFGIAHKHGDPNFHLSHGTRF
jgi:hypothetical protein